MKTKKYSTVMVIGSGATKISQSGEFDFSGCQALKVLKKRGIKSILLNPNIATVQTSGLADRTYLYPLALEYAAEVIETERPDGILLQFGGQAALNLGVELEQAGVLDKFGVDVLGTPIASIVETEDRDLFKKKLEDICVLSPESFACSTPSEALAAADKIGYPVMLRNAFSLGGEGSGKVENKVNLLYALERAFSVSKQVLIEEWLGGWKEIEFEVVRDASGCMVVACDMENFDPVGVHTGDSIVVAPAQTLQPYELNELKRISKAIAEHVGIIGECNVQFALRPSKHENYSVDYRVIEMNARLSRSSALASKATGYPLARVACEVALGARLGELESSTAETTMDVEPSIQHTVVKVPRWDFGKFDCDHRIGSEMRSVGEAMGIGRGFVEALQKAIRMTECGKDGLVPAPFEVSELGEPTDDRLFKLYGALLYGVDINEIASVTGLDTWFLRQLEVVADAERDLIENYFCSFGKIEREKLAWAKRLGFSDERLATLTGATKEVIRSRRIELSIVPIFKKIDTYGGRFKNTSNFFYATYEDLLGNDLALANKCSHLVLGSGVYRIGSSVEFDWSCMSAVKTLSSGGFATAVINCNPETVSTDHDEVDRVYFEELTLERILDIAAAEGDPTVVISFGGQTPNNLCRRLADNRIKIMGTSPKSIDEAEDRTKFSAILDSLGVPQPKWAALWSEEDAYNFADKVGYPVLVRPSYVLSGAAMSVAYDEKSMKKVLEKAVSMSGSQRIVVSKFYEGVKEVDVDGAAHEGAAKFTALSAHIENAGTHSGDASLLFPAPRGIMSREAREKCLKYTKLIVDRLSVTGPFNVQFLVDGDEAYVIECNLRASRSFPFVSKVSGVDLSREATLAMMATPNYSREYRDLGDVDAGPFGCKAAQFSFARLKGADPVSGVEMASTGEVGCVSLDPDRAMALAFEAVGIKRPKSGEVVIISSGRRSDKFKLQKSLLRLMDRGIEMHATRGSFDFLNKDEASDARVINSLDRIRELVKARKVGLIVNIPKNDHEDELWDDYEVRRLAVEKGIPLITNSELAKKLIDAWTLGNLLPARRPPSHGLLAALEDFVS